MQRSAPLADSDASWIAIDVWSDIACPWCYIGKRNLEAGIAAFGAGDGAPVVTVTYHSFELDPDAPIEFEGTADVYLAQRKGIDIEGARQMHARVTAFAADAGLTYDFARVRGCRTGLAHQLTHYAKARGLQAEAIERLFASHFSEGRSLGRPEELADLGAEIGLDRAGVLRSLAAGEFREAVLDDERQAAAIGIGGVPFYVIDARYGLSGAQAPEIFAAALRQVASERRVPAS